MSRHLIPRAALPLSLLLLMGASPALAQDADAIPAPVVLDGGETNGVVAANIATGNANQQANVGAIATGGAASSLGAVAQSLDAPADGQDAGDVGIAPGAFAGSNGWIAVNLANGSANQQANLNVIGIGTEGNVATAALLAQSRGSVAPAAEETGEESVHAGTVAIGEGAFQDSSGLVQLSLIGGDRNSSANVFTLSVAGSEN